MAKSLSFADNLVEYEINGRVTVRFNPTDETFVGNLERAFSSLDGLQGELAEDGGFDRFVKLDKEMRETIDGLLGNGVADALFPNMNCYALADGLPVWMNLVLALVDEVGEAYEREFGKTDVRLKEHGAKYDAMLAKYRKAKK